MNTRRILLAVLAVFLALILYGTTRVLRKVDEAPLVTPPPSQIIPLSSPTIVTPSPPTTVPPTAPSSPAAGTAPKAVVQTFRARFGRDLRIVFFPDGHASAVRGTVGENQKAVGFRADDRQKVLARVHEILDGGAELLGLRPEYPLDEPQIRGTNVSAQAYLRETYQGVPLEPLGKVTVDLGQEGEIVGVYSTYVPNFKVVNARNLNADQARAAAGAGATGGQPILWVGGGASGMEGRQAYEYTKDGRQVVVDAQNGQVLIQRDRRHF